ncbi:innexin inx2-like [Uloborus diversus]|uniref:innexin inx2-like n=1 Tax=Uloborus diversus TaxID=327109 RepID=UPI00240A3508|nr:innexin inx2-like [Uloborus diversus]
MLGVFESLKGLLKAHSVCIDGPAFRLHYRCTVLFLLSASLLLSCRQYFGDPIHCIQNDVRRIDAVENFCWIHSTFTLPHAWNKTVGVSVPHPGIDTHKEGQDKLYQGYYQWVALVLLLQGILFYLPRYLWKIWEKGIMKAYALDLKYPLLPTCDSTKSYKLLTHSLHIHWGHNRSYCTKYVFCEVLALVNVVFQMLLLDKFLGGAFTTFGIEVLKWTEWEQDYRTDPLVKRFPRMTKCVFYDYGSSGDVQKVDALCLLPLNILNEKIFIILWFWMVFLCVVSAITLFYRFLLAAMPMLRYCVLVNRAPQASKGALDRLVGSSGLSDWFVLYLLAENIDSTHYCAVVSSLVAAMDQNVYDPVAVRGFFK